VVTNKHVLMRIRDGKIQHANTVEFPLHKKDPFKHSPTSDKILAWFMLDMESLVNHPSESVDICILRVSQMKFKKNATIDDAFIVSLADSLILPKFR
jgi:hypothetical protein